MKTAAKSIQSVLVERASRDKPWLILPTDPVSSSEAVRLNFSEVHNGALAAASALRNRGAETGHTVGIIFDNGPHFCFAFFGALMAGMTPVPLPVPRLAKLDEYGAYLQRVARGCRLRFLLADPHVTAALKHVSELPDAFTPEHPTSRQTGSQQEVVLAEPDDLALIQYTSGSTGLPRGVELTHRNLLSNVAAIGEALEVRPDDVDASWLPLFHDMGLIGALLFSLYWNLPLVLLSPRVFLQRPHAWLWAICRFSTTLSPAPNFAYQVCASLPPDDVLRDLDLSSWRAAITGSELIHASTVHAFCNRYGRHGFDPNAMLPAYGLAENALGVSLTRYSRFRTEPVARKALQRHGTAPALADTHARTVVCVGAPLDGQELRIADQHGNRLADRVVGEVQVRGPSVMKAYHRDPEATRRAFTRDGWLKTGDRGYLANGQLYVLGREKDVIKKAGANYDAADIERAAKGADSGHLGRIVAFGTPNATRGTEDLVVLAETPVRDAARLLRLRADISRSVLRTCNTRPDRIHFFEPKTFGITTSGKTRNRYTRDRYMLGSYSHLELPTE